MREPIQSAGGIVYYLDPNDGLPRFLLLKRYALSKKIEWVAPKGKINPGESPQDAAVRETHEEVGVAVSSLSLQCKVGDLNLSLFSEEKGSLDKDIAYFLIKFLGNPTDVNVGHIEGYIGVYGWYKIEDILGLIYYENFREIFRKAYNMIVNPGK